MAKWEYAMYYADTFVKKTLVGDAISVSAFIKTKNDKGQTCWDVLNEYGEHEWELVSACPIEDYTGSGTYTKEVLFVFKRSYE